MLRSGHRRVLTDLPAILFTRYPVHRLKDVLWDNRRLYLIMEYLDCDLQEHIASCRSALGTTEVKVGLTWHSCQ